MDEDVCHMAATRIVEKLLCPRLGKGCQSYNMNHNLFIFLVLSLNSSGFKILGVSNEDQTADKVAPFLSMLSRVRVLEAVELLRCRLPRTT